MIEGTIESYMIDGKLYVTTSFVSAFFQTDPRNIRNWKKDGLSSKKERGVRQDLFLFDEVYKWNKENINQNKSRAGKKKKEPTNEVRNSNRDKKNKKDFNIRDKIDDIKEEIGKKEVENLPQYELKEVIENLEKLTKLEIAIGDLIPKRDTEKVIIEFAITLIAGYKRDIKILPKECMQRSEEEIKKILEVTYKTNIEKYHKIAKSDKTADTNITDIIDMTTELIYNDISTDDILSKMKELLEVDD